MTETDSYNETPDCSNINWTTVRGKILFKNTSSTVEIIGNSIRKTCKGSSAIYSKHATEFIQSNNNKIGHIFVPIIEHAEKLNNADNRDIVHMTLLELYDIDMLEWINAYKKSLVKRGKWSECMYTVVQFLVTSFDAMFRVGMTYTDLKPDNILLKLHKDKTISDIRFGDVESFRPFPCDTFRLTYGYISYDLTTPVLSRNIKYIRGTSDKIIPPRPRDIRIRHILHQIGIIVGIMVENVFSPNEIWWEMLRENNLGQFYATKLCKFKWFRKEWVEVCKKSPFEVFRMYDISRDVKIIIKQEMRAALKDEFNQILYNWMSCVDMRVDWMSFMWSCFNSTNFSGISNALSKLMSVRKEFDEKESHVYGNIDNCYIRRRHKYRRVYILYQDRVNKQRISKRSHTV